MVQSSCSGGRSPAGSALLEAAGVLVGGGVQSTSGAAGQLGGCLLANAGQRLRGLPPLHPGAGGQQLGSLPPRPTMAPRQPVSLERATSLYGRASGCHNAHYWFNGRAFRGLLGADRPDSHTIVPASWPTPHERCMRRACAPAVAGAPAGPLASLVELEAARRALLAAPGRSRYGGEQLVRGWATSRIGVQTALDEHRHISR